MELNKEILSKKIIPSLFYDKDGKRILRISEEYFKNNNITLSKLIKKFNESSNDYKYEPFWEEVTKIVNHCYNSNIKLSSYNLSTGFNKLVYDLLKTKFDFEFDSDEEKKIENKEALEKFLKDLVDNSEALQIESGDGIKRIILPYEKNYHANVNPNSPQKLKEYPNIFIKIEGDKISIDCSSSKRIHGFVSNIQSLKKGEDKILSEFNHNGFEKLQVDVKNFFTNLKDEGFFITQLKFNSPTFYFNTGSKLVIDYEKLIDSDFYLNSILDFINLEQLKLIYNETFEDKNRDFKITIKANCQDLDENVKIIKYSIKINKDKNLTPAIRNKILSKLKSIGIEDGCSYDLPVEYYINKLLHSSGNLKKIYRRILELDKNNLILTKLTQHKVIKTEGEDITVDLDKLVQVLLESFTNLTNINYSSEGEQFSITKSFIDEKGRLSIDFKLFNDDKRINQFYQGIIYDNVRDYDKILKIVIYNLDKAFVLNNFLNDNKEVLLQYLYLKIKNYLNYEYNLQLEKESISAHKYLVEYSKEFSNWEKERDPKKLGAIVEKKINILLKYLYRNYRPLGGARKPDGYLPKNDDEGYLFDSKQHKNIYQGEIDKISRYLFTFNENVGIEKVKEGVLIVCRGKLNNTLNKEAIDQWKKSDYFSKNYSMSFVSLEFILKIYELLKKPQSNNNLKLKQKILDSIFSSLNKSKKFNKKESLVKSEDEIIGSIEKMINEEKYSPKREGML